MKLSLTQLGASKTVTRFCDNSGSHWDILDGLPWFVTGFETIPKRIFFCVSAYVGGGVNGRIINVIWGINVWFVALWAHIEKGSLLSEVDDSVEGGT